MSKHIPGPWRIHKFGDTKNHSIYADGWSRPIASIRGRTPEEQEDTAKLVAAAPELLSACEVARDALSAALAMFEDRRAASQEAILNARQALRDAIGKIEIES